MSEPTDGGEGGFRNRVVGLEVVAPGDLALHPKNWRLHPEGQRSALLAALGTIGIADAVIAYKSEKNGGQLTLIDGHLRRDLLDKIPVLVTDLNDDEADMLLASHDVITTMAHRDEEILSELLDGVGELMPRDLLLAIDPDLSGSESEELTVDESEAVKYPILPEYDEGYDSVVVFATTEADFAWMEKELKLPTVRDRKRIGMSHVMTVAQFRERWATRGKKAPAESPAESPE